MTYYPVCIPTLNRYEHLKACVESLRLCTHADKTELVIGLDALPSGPKGDSYRKGFVKIKAWLPTITGFAKVTVLERESNYGPERNSRTLSKYCLERYDAYIYTEDDNVFSPCFLDFMDKALERYRDDGRIMSVCGYISPGFYGTGMAGTFLTYDCAQYGMGCWGHKYREVNSYVDRQDLFVRIVRSRRLSGQLLAAYPFNYFQLVEMLRQGVSWGDVKWTAYQVVTGHLQLRPSVSLVRNLGFDGSGLHCGTQSDMDRQIISTATVFDLLEHPAMQRTDIAGRGPRYVCMPADPESYRREMRAMHRRALRIRLRYTRPWCWILSWLAKR